MPPEGRVDQAASVREDAVLLGAVLDLRPEGEDRRRVEGRAHGARERLDRRVAFGVGLEVAVEYHVLVVNDQHSYREAALRVLRGD